MYNNYEERIELLNKQLVSEYKKNDELQTRIDKAIDILNKRSHTKDVMMNMLNNLNTMDKVIDILKGENNE